MTALTDEYSVFYRESLKSLVHGRCWTRLAIVLTPAEQRACGLPDGDVFALWGRPLRPPSPPMESTCRAPGRHPGGARTPSALDKVGKTTMALSTLPQATTFLSVLVITINPFFTQIFLNRPPPWNISSTTRTSFKITLNGQEVT